MRVLVIEHSQELRNFLKKALESECFTVDSLDNGERGSFAARTNNYGLILLADTTLTKNSLDVCREIRAIGKHTPIIIMTHKAEPQKRIAFLNCGADSCIAKPFSYEELSAHIRAVLRRPQDIASEVIKINSIEIDTVSQEVKKSGRDIYLTKKEYELISYLARHRGQVLSRSKIIENVWDMNADLFSNTLETHILNLRRKLDLNPLKIIKTVPGRGYKIENK